MRLLPLLRQAKAENKGRRRAMKTAAENRNALDLPSWKIEGVVKAYCYLLIYDGKETAAFSARRHLVFPGAYVVVSVNNRQGFLTSGSNALLHGLPNLRTDQ
jgi:hypothetical protein